VIVGVFVRFRAPLHCNELKNVMKVRAKALSQFGQNNIRKGTPMAMLEDVFVPIYLFHRYQIEAVSKWLVACIIPMP
jgi:hypothetical protein